MPRTVARFLLYFSPSTEGGSLLRNQGVFVHSKCLTCYTAFRCSELLDYVYFLYELAGTAWYRCLSNMLHSSLRGGREGLRVSCT